MFPLQLVPDNDEKECQCLTPPSTTTKDYKPEFAPIIKKGRKNNKKTAANKNATPSPAEIQKSLGAHFDTVNKHVQVQSELADPDKDFKEFLKHLQEHQRHLDTFKDASVFTNLCGPISEGSHDNV